MPSPWRTLILLCTHRLSPCGGSTLHKIREAWSLQTKGICTQPPAQWRLQSANSGSRISHENCFFLSLSLSLSHCWRSEYSSSFYSNVHPLKKHWRRENYVLNKYTSNRNLRLFKMVADKKEHYRFDQRSVKKICRLKFAI